MESGALSDIFDFIYPRCDRATNGPNLTPPPFTCTEREWEYARVEHLHNTYICMYVRSTLLGCRLQNGGAKNLLF